MAYTSPDDVKAVLARDSSSASYTGADLSDSQLAIHIDSADAQIDAMLNNRYDVPFDPVPPQVHHLSTDIAAYLADLTYRGHKDYSSDLDPIYLRYRRATDMLTSLNTGVARIEQKSTSTETYNPYINNRTPQMFDLASFRLGYSESGRFGVTEYDPDYYRS